MRAKARLKVLHTPNSIEPRAGWRHAAYRTRDSHNLSTIMTYTSNVSEKA